MNHAFAATAAAPITKDGVTVPVASQVERGVSMHGSGGKDAAGEGSDRKSQSLQEVDEPAARRSSPDPPARKRLRSKMWLESAAT